ncbi:MAG: CPBP family intramembrane metalloprotease [Acidobacteria bacterium]|nr:CPBP family intramembrane metalloprotease [Acidobacteriota bacterium]
MTAIISSTIFLVVVGAFIPVAAWMSKKALDQGLRVERLDFYLETVVIQTVLVALSLWVSRSNELAITFRPAGGVQMIIGAAGLTVIALLALGVGWRASSVERRDRLRMIVPFSREEKFAWVGVSIAAGVAEELIYRAVLFGLILTWTGEVWIAALVAGVSFALAHLVQGWIAVLIVFVYGLLFQVLYVTSGSLFAPVLVHVIYDLLAGLLISRWSRRDDEQTL